ncbi:MAG: hypothetical protein QW756_06120 [Nitrososphaerota archaeon]
MKLLVLAVALVLIGLILISAAGFKMEFFGFFLIGPFPILLAGGDGGEVVLTVLLLVIFFGLLWLVLRR